MTTVPHIPESAPFTAEQRAWLNGFLAGIFSRAPAPEAPAKTPINILFGSQTGNSESLAKRAAKELTAHGLAPAVFDLAQYPREKLSSDTNLLIVTSTYGDGDPPDNAKAFWEFLNSADAPSLSQTRYSVLALGDSNYPKFCECGKNFDLRLEALGASRLAPRVDCDLEYEQPFQSWLSQVTKSLSASESKVEHGSAPAPSSAPPPPSRSNPFPARLLANRLLNQPGSRKDTRHLEIAAADLAYEVGDALGVQPCNCPELVSELLAALHFTGDESVPGKDKAEVPIREALLRHYEITKIPQPLLKAIAEREKSTVIPINGELSAFLWGRDILDLLLTHSQVRFAPAEFVALLKKLQPRLYSIASSPKAHPGQIHLTLGVLRYESLHRSRKGVCSTFLAERVAPDTPLPIFIQPAKHFRPPADPSRPIVMVGPGTGIAPFRAFLEERRALGAKGKNWLFFGDQHAAADFLYRDELESMQKQGTLTRLDTAFSRDQSEKVYVQNRMLESAPEIFRWLEDGAHFYVCGDAQRMAKDVHAALQHIIQLAGHTADSAAAYVKTLQSTHRYQRDVY